MLHRLQLLEIILAKPGGTNNKEYPGYPGPHFSDHMNQAYEYISAVGQNTSLFMSNLDNAATTPASVFCNESGGGDLMPGFLCIPC